MTINHHIMKYVTKAKADILSLAGKIPRHEVQIHVNHELHGTVYGGYSICPKGIDQNSVVYSFGIGEDVSFDLSLINKYNLNVFAFDPTPKALSWIKSQKMPNNFSYFDYGLADFNGIADLYLPINPSHVSASILSRDTNSFEAKMRRLKTIMDDLGHDHIDILKMDIEGAEYQVIPDILDLDISQILLEFHHSLVSKMATNRAVAELNHAGYQIFWISDGKDVYSFIRK